MKINIVARKRLEIDILTRHICKNPPPPESNGRLIFVVNVCFVCRICLGCFAWRTGWICRPLIEQTDALTMYNVFYLWMGSTSIGHARHVKTRNDNVLRILIFSQKLPFSVGKNNVSKTNLGSTIHYTYTSYNKYFRLCVVSEELRLNEISLFL